MKRMNWRLVFLFSLSGVFFAVLTIFAWIHGYEHWFALATIVLVAKFIALMEHDAPIKHGFAAGFFTALFALWTQAAFAPIYLKNNPAYREVEIPFGLDPLTYTILFSPIGGLMAGILAVFVAWPVAKLYLALRTI